MLVDGDELDDDAVADVAHLVVTLLDSGMWAPVTDTFGAVFLDAATLQDAEFHIVGALISVLVVSVRFDELSLLAHRRSGGVVVKGGMGIGDREVCVEQV